MSRPAPVYIGQFKFDIDPPHKKHHDDDDDDDNDYNDHHNSEDDHNGEGEDGHNGEDDHNQGGKGGRRITLLEQAFKRRADELKNLQDAFSESLDGKRPLDPPTQFGTAVQRAWLHSVDPHDYRDLLEQEIDRAQISLVKLEEKL